MAMHDASADTPVRGAAVVEWYCKVNDKPAWLVMVSSTTRRLGLFGGKTEEGDGPFPSSVSIDKLNTEDPISIAFWLNYSRAMRTTLIREMGEESPFLPFSGWEYVTPPFPAFLTAAQESGGARGQWWMISTWQTVFDPVKYSVLPVGKHEDIQPLLFTWPTLTNEGEVVDDDEQDIALPFDYQEFGIQRVGAERLQTTEWALNFWCSWIRVSNSPAALLESASLKTGSTQMVLYGKN